MSKHSTLSRGFRSAGAIWLMIAIAASVTADPASDTRGPAIVDNAPDCMMTFIARGESLTPLFPTGEGLFQVLLNHATSFVIIDEDREMAILTCHGILLKGVPLLGTDVATGNTVTAEFVSNEQACAVAASIGADWCNPSGRGTVVFTQANTGASCAFYDDWRAVIAPSGRTTLRCTLNIH